MISSSQRLRSLTPNVMVLGSGWTHRVGFGALAIFMTVVTFWGGRVGVVPLVIALFLAFGSLFVDDWYFDAEHREVRRRSGLLFLAHTRRIPLEDINRIALVKATRGPAKSSFCRTVLVVPASELILEMGQGAPAEYEAHARTIADHMGIELEMVER